MCIAPAPRVTVRFSHADPFNTNHLVSTFQGRLTPFLLIRPNTTPRSPRNFGLMEASGRGRGPSEQPLVILDATVLAQGRLTRRPTSVLVEHGRVVRTGTREDPAACPRVREAVPGFPFYPPARVHRRPPSPDVTGCESQGGRREVPPRRLG